MTNLVYWLSEGDIVADEVVRTTDTHIYTKSHKLKIDKATMTVKSKYKWPQIYLTLKEVSNETKTNRQSA